MRAAACCEEGGPAFLKRAGRPGEKLPKQICVRSQGSRAEWTVCCPHASASEPDEILRVMQQLRDQWGGKLKSW